MYTTQGIHGIAYGMILFLIASALTIISGMMGILNLAHAAFFMKISAFGHLGELILTLGIAQVILAWSKYSGERRVPLQVPAF